MSDDEVCDIAVLDYGIGNLRSAEKAFVSLGYSARLISDPDHVSQARAVVLPGVGSFGACASALIETGLAKAATKAVARGIPFLGICVGYQLLFEDSEESPGAYGLGVCKGTVRKLKGTPRLPHMQWNKLEYLPGQHSQMFPKTGGGPETWMYFVHSFAPEIGEVTVATCNYGEEIGAGIECDHVWGTQFHPEKSGNDGMAMLGRFAKFAGLKAGKGKNVERGDDHQSGAVA